MQWIDFKNQKPTEEGQYLWAQNNWDSRKTSGERVLTRSVRIAYWNGKAFRADEHTIISPDQWAPLPMPEPALKPT
jgi:hypothetical protein